MNRLKFKKGYAETLWGDKALAYYVMDGNTAIGIVYSWESFYTKKIYDAYLKMFNKRGEINYVVYLGRFGKFFEVSTLNDIKQWFEKNWDSENFQFLNEKEIEKRLISFPTRPKISLSK
jgi:hypothetical protein